MLLYYYEHVIFGRKLATNHHVPLSAAVAAYAVRSLICCWVLESLFGRPQSNNYLGRTLNSRGKLFVHIHTITRGFCTACNCGSNNVFSEIVRGHLIKL